MGDQRTELNVVTANSQRIQLTNHIGNLKTTEVFTQDGDFSMLMLNGYSFAGEEGKPMLPVQNRLFIIPPGSKPAIRVLSSNQIEIDLKEIGVKKPVYPLQPSAPKRQDAGRAKFQMDRKAYRKDAYFGQELVRIEILGRMRGHLIARLSVSPLQYNPVRNRLKIITESEIEIVFSPDENFLKSSINEHITPYDDFVFKSFLNPPNKFHKSGGLP